jgi:hypothetical protein
MRKHLLAVLSVFGLAGSSTPASAQVVKAAQKADTKSESTMKKSKLSQEDAASKDARKDKWKVQSAEGGHATSDASAKMRKAGGEQNASKQDSSKKVLIGLSQPSKNDADAKMRKAGGEQQEQKAGYMKLEKSKSELNASQGAAQYKEQKALGDGSVKTATGTTAHGSGGGAGKVAMQDVHIKGEKSAAEAKAVQQDAAKKERKQVNQASPK